MLRQTVRGAAVLLARAGRARVVRGVSPSSSWPSWSGDCEMCVWQSTITKKFPPRETLPSRYDLTSLPGEVRPPARVDLIARSAGSVGVSRTSVKTARMPHDTSDTLRYRTFADHP